MNTTNRTFIYVITIGTEVKGAFWYLDRARSWLADEYLVVVDQVDIDAWAMTLDDGTQVRITQTEVR